MMREIGGYIELDTYHLPMLHEGAIALNCGRNALAYVIRARGIKRIKLPYYLCSSILEVCRRENVKISFYHIDDQFRPVDIKLHENEWFYFVNYYSQFSNDQILEYKQKYGNIIVDQAHSYFQMPIPGIDTIYTCRKYFGVPDGAFLYTDSRLDEELRCDESYDRMKFLLGRYERTAAEFYNEYKENNSFFATEPVKKMSKLTTNLLHAIDYNIILKTRQNNYEYLHNKLKNINELKLNDVLGTYMYPLMLKNSIEIRKKLQLRNIYIPTLWPNVIELCEESDIEYHYSMNILPLPIDQRYQKEDLVRVVEEILCMKI